MTAAPKAPPKAPPHTTCHECGKPLTRYIANEGDNFCSTACAKTFHGVALTSGQPPTAWQKLPERIRAIALAELTPRQQRVLQDTLNGHSARTIARALHLTEPTVRTHLERALTKMQPHLQKDAA